MRTCSTDRQFSIDWDRTDRHLRSFSLPSTLDYSTPPPGYPSLSSGYSSTSPRTSLSYPQAPSPSRHQPFAAGATSHSRNDRLDTRYYTLQPLDATAFEPIDLEESWELIPSMPLQSRTVSDASQNGVGHQASGTRHPPRSRCVRKFGRKERPQKLRLASQAPKMSKLARLLGPVQREEQSSSTADAYASSRAALNSVGTEERISNAGYRLGGRALRFAPSTHIIIPI